MTALQAAPIAGRLLDVVRSATPRVVLGGSAVAWAALGSSWLGLGVGGLGGMPRHHDPSMGPPGTSVVDPWNVAWVSTWLLMVVAMMWPLAIPTVTAVARSSFRGWRARLAIVCLATVTVLWLSVGLAGATLARTFSVPPGGIAWQLSFICLALVAFRSARRSRLLESCLQLPVLAPGGRRGIESAVRAGLLAWRRCAVLCGPVMLAMMVGHGPALMVPASMAAWWEAWHPRAWRDPVPVALMATAGVGLVVSALLGTGAGHG